MRVHVRVRVRVHVFVFVFVWALGSAGAFAVSPWRPGAAKWEGRRSSLDALGADCAITSCEERGRSGSQRHRKPTYRVVFLRVEEGEVPTGAARAADARHASGCLLSLWGQRPSARGSETISKKCHTVFDTLVPRWV